MKYCVPDLLDKIKAKYEDSDSKSISMYRLMLQSHSGDPPVFSIASEEMLEYDDLCVRMFDLDVHGWEVMDVEDSSRNFTSPYNMYETIGFILVTITLCRKL